MNVTAILPLMIIAFAEGIFMRMWVTSYTRNYYALGKDYNESEYQEFYLIVTCAADVSIFVIALLLGSNLSLVLYLCALGVVLSGLIKFNVGRDGYVNNSC
ncbi:hypothetical protein FWF48_03555 [Candidatus Saccharibacteria bacterium]|nr:hypothetical protein [Candidatus Saccharibacteria bacterium]